MNPRANIQYHTKLWPAACRGQRWNHRDQTKRRAVVLDCMRQVRGPLVTTSDALFGPDETTALFTFLAHLADPASFDKSARWGQCKADYRTFNRARQADWHEEQTYGRGGSGKLRRDRFAGERTAAQGPLEDLDAEKTRQRHMTMANKHDRKKRADRSKAAAQAARSFYTPGTAVPPAGCVILLPAPADLESATYSDPDPAYVAPDGEAF